MNTTKRIVAGAAVAVTAAVGFNTAEHYNVDENARLHEAQACALELDKVNNAASAVVRACSTFKYIAEDSTIAGNKMTIVTKDAFVATEIPRAERFDDTVSQNRDRRLNYMYYPLSLLIGAAAFRMIRPDNKADKQPVRTVGSVPLATN